ncbi:MAG: two component transcriptional regulator, LuxR family [Verrucomicrobiaceae bacterium]|nr:two component transcriptional regulator, LuxR family [Verrucomicrobiaceae bacterium]
MPINPPDNSPSTARARVLVVDDHPIFRAGLMGLVAQETDLTVCGEAHNAAQALAAIDVVKPDLVLLDMGLPDKSGLELLKDIRVMHPSLSVLIISMHDESLYAERVLRAGGRGYIMKQEGPEKILKAIRKVLSGKVYVSDETSAAILDGMSGVRAQDTSTLVSKLTDREFEILTLIGQGKDAPDIAKQLHLSIKTVDTHRMHIRDKLSLKSNSELIHYAVRWSSADP